MNVTEIATIAALAGSVVQPIVSVLLRMLTNQSPTEVATATAQITEATARVFASMNQEIGRLQARVDVLESENERLREQQPHVHNRKDD